MRTIMVMFVVVTMYLLLGATVGMRWTLFLMSLIFFSMSTIFLTKKEYYLKYFKFVSPKQVEISNEKGDEFKRKNRITNIVCWYILSGLFLLQGAMTSNNRLLFERFGTKGLILIGSIVLIFSILLWAINMFILKKSRTNTEFVVYSIILGIIAVLIIMGVVVQLLLKLV